MSHNVASYVKDNFDGMLVFGDVHGDYVSFKRAYDYAKSENFFFMSLGDLVDRDRQPYEVVEAMYNAMYDGRAGFTVGNHDNKYYRFANGAKVSFSRDAQRTFEDVGEERKEEFMRMYCGIIEMPMQSAIFHRFDDILLVHAAAHKEMWDPTVTKLGKSAQSRALVGETINEIGADGYPIRLYNWVEDVPMGKTVVIGHDKQPVDNIPIEKPLHMTNKNGGKVIFMDTGCGKGGFLSGMVILHDKKGFKVDSFMEFK